MKVWNRIYSVLVIVLAVTPGVLFHPSMNPISLPAWDYLTEQSYSGLLRFQQPLTQDPSDVVIIEVDDKSLEKLGWPIDRSFYVKFLERMRSLGHPWILSNLWFESLEGMSNSPIPLERRKELDVLWADSIKEYRRFIGTGIKFDEDEEPTTYQEEKLLPKIVRLHPPSEFIPGPLDFKFIDADRFVDGQAAFGFFPQLGSGTIHCAQLMLAGPTSEGSTMAIPSSILWAAALGTGRSLAFGENFRWGSKPNALPMHVGGRHCLTSPSVTTKSFFKARQMADPISFKDVLTPGFRKSFAGKIVILAQTEGATYVDGPGIIKSNEIERRVYEHELHARFLDNIVTGRTIIRPNSHVAFDKIGPFLIATTGALGLLFLSLEVLCTLMLSAFLILAFAGSYYLSQGQFVLPMHTAAASFSTCIGLFLLLIAARVNAVKLYLRFSSDLRKKLAQCNSLESMEQTTISCMSRYFAGARCYFEYDQEYYQASESNAALLRLSSKLNTTQAIIGTTVLTENSQFLHQSFKHWFRFRLKKHLAKIELQVHSDTDALGKIRLSITYSEVGRYLAEPIFDALGEELSVHWHRVKMLVEQRVKEFKLVEEKSRADIMSRFLSQAVIGKFSSDRSVDENLAGILIAKESRAALLQADIRGYSNFSAQMQPLDTVNMLRSYYQNVVNVAQQVAQVKLIGDCIFLFIERGYGNKIYSPTDLMLQISAILVKDTLFRNNERGGNQINFGIAIHYGDVVVGNLSSEECIDYTVIGPNVNQVARMEELTKQDKIQELVGLNGVILSEEAKNSLVAYRELDLKPIDLNEYNVSVRSFSNVNRVYFLKSADVLKIIDINIFSGLEYGERFAG